MYIFRYILIILITALAWMLSFYPGLIIGASLINLGTDVFCTLSHFR